MRTIIIIAASTALRIDLYSNWCSSKHIYVLVYKNILNVGNGDTKAGAMWVLGIDDNNAM